jgi:predicted ATPase/DNA-binding XRE family transcriptional regulator
VNQSFPEFLRTKRCLAGLTQQALADLSSVSTRTIRDLEAGRAKARIQTVHLLADALRLAGPDRDGFVRAAVRGEAQNPPSAALPKPVNALVGREREVRAIVDALVSGQSRITPLSGLPGVGKTRIAAEVAAQLGAGYGWPVLWMDEAMAGRARLESSLSPVLRSLHSLIERNAAGLARVRQFLRDREALIVLDDIAAEVEPFGVEELLASCPSVRVISTSRIPWQVAGVESAVISPLRTPPIGPGGDLSPEDLARVPSARLLLSRLSEVRPEFELTPANARAAAETCRKLDGLPLALEAAARQFRVLSLRQLAEAPIADLLDLRLPARPAAGAGLGAQTLAGVLEHSIGRHDAQAQAVLRRLATVEEGFTVAEVVRLLRRPVHVVLDELGVLIGSGLVLASPGEQTVLNVPNLVRALLGRTRNKPR